MELLDKRAKAGSSRAKHATIKPYPRQDTQNNTLEADWASNTQSKVLDLGLRPIQLFGKGHNKLELSVKEDNTDNWAMVQLPENKSSYVAAIDGIGTCFSTPLILNGVQSKEFDSILRNLDFDEEDRMIPTPLRMVRKLASSSLGEDWWVRDEEVQRKEFFSANVESFCQAVLWP